MNENKMYSPEFPATQTDELRKATDIVNILVGLLDDERFQPFVVINELISPDYGTQTRRNTLLLKSQQLSDRGRPVSAVHFVVKSEVTDNNDISTFFEHPQFDLIVQPDGNLYQVSGEVATNMQIKSILRTFKYSKQTQDNDTFDCLVTPRNETDPAVPHNMRLASLGRGLMKQIGIKETYTIPEASITFHC